MYGIDNLKKFVKFACDFTNQATDSLADGWQWLDATSFFDEMLQIPGIVKALPDIKQELADLTLEERDELYAYLKQEFDLPNEKLEGFVEDSIAFVLAALSLVEKWKALKTP